MSENTPDPDCNFGYVVGEKLDSIEKKIDNRAEESDLKNLENKIEELSENFEQLFNEIHLNGYADEIRKLKRVLERIENKRQEEQEEKEKEENKGIKFKREIIVAMVASLGGALWGYLFSFL